MNFPFSSDVKKAPGNVQLVLLDWQVWHGTSRKVCFHKNCQSVM